MSDRKLAVLGIIAVALAALVILQSRFSRTYTPPQITLAPLIEGWMWIRCSLSGSIRKTLQSKCVLRRKEDAFVVAEKDNYPANLKQKVNSLISDCLDIPDPPVQCPRNIRIDDFPEDGGCPGQRLGPGAGV